MAVTASSVREAWGISAQVSDDWLTARIAEAVAGGTYRSATGEEGLTAYIAHKAMLYEQRLGAAGGRKVVAASHNAASKTLESAPTYTPRTPEEAAFFRTDAGAAYVLLYRQHPLPYLVIPS